MRRPCSSNSSAADVIEMPRCCSSSIQSDVAWRRALRPRTAPASSMAPAYSSSFSVSVVLPASGCEIIANVRRLATSRSSSTIAGAATASPGSSSEFWRPGGTESETGLTQLLYSVAAVGRIPNTDLDVFPLCLGGNVFGWTADEQQSFDVLDAYAAAGGNFIDTADVYSAWVPGQTGGESETIIGRWMATRGTRSRMVIATKVGMKPGLKGLSPDTIRTAAEDSLRRLATDRIDLYYAHADDPDTPLAESLGAFDVLLKQGKVRYVAASNYTAPRLAEALAVSSREGLVALRRAATALQPRAPRVTTKASCAICAPARSWPVSRTTRWPRGFSPASTVRARRSTARERAPHAPTSTSAGCACSPPSTRSPPRTTPRWPPCRSRGSLRSRRWWRRLPARAWSNNSPSSCRSSTSP